MNHSKTLFAKYINDDCTAAEIKVLLNNFADVKGEAELKEAIAEALQKERMPVNDEELNVKMLDIYAKLKPKLQSNEQLPVLKKSSRSYFKYSIAASFILLFSALTYFYINHNQPQKQLTSQHLANDVKPGGNKAILTLANGQKILITDAKNGELAKQAGITISKTADGEIVYEIVADATTQVGPTYNTISTPAGGQYSIKLPDGTRVWLNSESSLKYPTLFSGTHRKVELTGEAYFEVAKDPSKPFIISTFKAGKVQNVTVLGTHFNISNYLNEPYIKTTLLEGSIKLNIDELTKTLKPGQQAVFGNNLQVFNVDTDLAVDWKNGNFSFNDEDLHSIMRRLARWYDIDVIYQENLPEINFGAEISRNKKLSEVLSVLEKAGGIHFKIEGRSVTVMH